MNGPVPVGVVVKVADWPGQTTELVKALAAVGVFTVKVAAFVTLLHVPLTSTVYVPASPVVTEGIVKVSVVAP